MLSQTAQRAVDAYGGAKVWLNARTLEVEVSAKGLAFTLKRRPFFQRAVMLMDVDRPFARFTPIGKDPGITGVLDGPDVRLEDKSGNVVQERKNARSFFPFGRRLFFWDDLDMAYFANYASWNYFTLPRLLLNESIQWIEKEPGLLEANFPPSIPSHSPRQTFRFDRTTGLLIQHNYAAEVISKLANAANVVKTHETSPDGLVFPSHRVVTPQSFSGAPLKGPVLIDLEIHSYRIKN